MRNEAPPPRDLAEALRRAASTCEDPGVRQWLLAMSNAESAEGTPRTPPARGK